VGVEFQINGQTNHGFEVMLVHVHHVRRRFCQVVS